MVTALYDFDGKEEDDELSFKKGALYDNAAEYNTNLNNNHFHSTGTFFFGKKHIHTPMHINTFSNKQNTKKHKNTHIGDTFKKLKQADSNGWATGMRNGKIGLFPDTYVN